MKNKPILLVAGQPKSVFFEIFFKSIKRNKFKSPIILICCQKILINEMKFFNLKKRIRLLELSRLNDFKLDNKKINVINIEYKKSTKKYIEDSFKIAFKQNLFTEV